jgi:hypothetical protein
MMRTCTMMVCGHVVFIARRTLLTGVGGCANQLYLLENVSVQWLTVAGVTRVQRAWHASCTPPKGEFHLEIDRALNHGFQNTVLQESEPFRPVRG